MNLSYWVTGLQAVTVVLAFIIGLQPPEQKHRNRILNAFLAVTVLATICSFVLIRQSDTYQSAIQNLLTQANQNALASSEAAKVASKASIAASEAAKAASASAKVASKTSLQAQQETIRARRESKLADAQLEESVDAADSHCYLTFTLKEADSGRFMMYATHLGNHTLHQVTGYIVDIRYMDEISKSPTLQEVQKQTNVLFDTHGFEVGDLIVGTLKQMGQLQVTPRSDMYKFNIFFTAENGHWSELYRAKHLASGWTQATLVMWQRHPGEKPEERQFVDPSYPRNKNGAINWQ